MIEAVKCFKFDMRIMKEKKQYIYLILIPFFTFIAMKHIVIGLTCFMSFLILYVGIPFANENGDKLEMIYGLLPYKSENAVLGRFLYMGLAVIVTLFICGGTSVYYSYVYPYEPLAIAELLIVVNVSVALDFISYPLYYEAQKDRRDGIKTAILVIVSLVILSIIIFIPIEIDKMTSTYPNELNFIGNLILNNKKSFFILDLLGVGFIYYLSYKVSCWIFYRKEV